MSGSWHCGIGVWVGSLVRSGLAVSVAVGCTVSSSEIIVS
jgi:hypothetical protein